MHVSYFLRLMSKCVFWSKSLFLRQLYVYLQLVSFFETSCLTCS